MLSFGKYKNHSVSDIYLRDRSYLEWLVRQPWFKTKNKGLYETIVTKLSTVTIPEPHDAFVIYTDGACKNNGSVIQGSVKAGYGIHFSERNTPKIPDVSERLVNETLTNNIAELVAIKVALQRCIEYGVTDNIVLYTDSDYALKCITLWYPQWVAKNTLDNKKNIEIIRDIMGLLAKTKVTFRHIRAHTGLLDEHSLGNAKADELANDSLK